jgi:peptidoglycan/LPS O-acetylase OafA/YrhL
VSIGRISYGLYVYHFVMPTVAVTLGPHYLHSRFPVLTVVALSFAVASLSWFVVEKPIMSLKRFFFYKARPFSTQQEDLDLRGDVAPPAHSQ